MSSEGWVAGHTSGLAVEHAHSALAGCVRQQARAADNTPAALRQGFSACDQLYLGNPRVLQEDRLGSGCGALVVYVQGGFLYAANLGASRAVLCIASSPQDLTRVPAPPRSPSCAAGGARGRKRS